MDFQAGLIVLIVFVSLFAIWLIFYFIPVGLWFSALVSGVRISLLQLILMRWRKVPPSTIVSSMIESTKAGLELNPNELEAHYLAGGNVTSVVHALVSAQKANIMLDFKMATAIDLAGRDVFEAVQMSVNPKVINTPPVAAVAKDGIQLIAKAREGVRVCVLYDPFGSYGLHRSYIARMREAGVEITNFHARHPPRALAPLRVNFRNHRKIAIVDGGFKAFSTDRQFPPEARNLAGAVYAFAGDEHGRVDMAGADRSLAVGDRVEFIIPHCDPSVNLYDRMYALRGDRVEAVWRVSARGMSQ